MTANVPLFLTHSFDLSPVMVGVYMLIASFCYGISTPIFGRISDSRNIGAHMMALCCFLNGIAISLYGPADFWRKWFGWDKPQKWLVLTISAVYGFFMGGMIMPTFGEMIIAAKQLKLHENELAQYGLVSGLWNTVFSIGDILGPTVGGVISVKCGFSNTVAIFGAAMIGMAALKTIHLIYLGCKHPEVLGDDQSDDSNNHDDRRHLLEENQSSIKN